MRVCASLTTATPNEWVLCQAWIDTGQFSLNIYCSFYIILFYYCCFVVLCLPLAFAFACMFVYLFLLFSHLLCQRSPVDIWWAFRITHAFAIFIFVCYLRGPHTRVQIYWLLLKLKFTVNSLRLRFYCTFLLNYSQAALMLIFIPLVFWFWEKFSLWNWMIYSLFVRWHFRLLCNPLTHLVLHWRSLAHWRLADSLTHRLPNTAYHWRFTSVPRSSDTATVTIFPSFLLLLYLFYLFNSAAYKCHFFTQRTNGRT